MATQWQIKYLRHVLDRTGQSIAELARNAGLAHTTINRPLKTPNWKYELKPDTIKAVAEATGIDPTPFIVEGAAEPPALYLGKPSRPRSQADQVLRSLPAPNMRGDFHVHLDGDIVRVSAAVDLATIPRLRKALDAMEDLLKQTEAKNDEDA